MAEHTEKWCQSLCNTFLQRQTSFSLSFDSCLAYCQNLGKKKKKVQLNSLCLVVYVQMKQRHQVET